MRLLLDESVPNKFRHSLTLHQVDTVADMGWNGLRNGQLLALAAIEFDVFITVDKNLPYQQNLVALPIAIVVLDAASIKLESLLPLVPALEQALASIRPRTYTLVSATPPDTGII